MSLAFERVTVTPAKASQWLENQIPNRNIGMGRVNSYAADMSTKDWQADTGETIKFTSDGRLLDGQHRLKAVVVVGKPVDMWACHDVPIEAFNVIDRNLGRTAAQALAMAGHKHANRLAGALKWLIRYEMMIGQETRGLPSSGRRPITTDEVLDAMERHPGIEESIRVTGHSTELLKIIFPTIVTFVHYKAAVCDAEKANEFVARLQDGANLEPKTPLLALRNLLLRDREELRRLPSDYVCAITVKAWKMHEAGQKIGVLKFLAQESFPIFTCDE